MDSSLCIAFLPCASSDSSIERFHRVLRSHKASSTTHSALPFLSPSQTDRCIPRLPDANCFCNGLHSSHAYSSALIECIISLFFRFHSFSVLSSDPVTSIYTSLFPSNPTFPEGVIALHVTLSVCPENSYASSTLSSVYGLGLTIRNAPAPNTEIVSSSEQQIALRSMHRLDSLLWDGTSSTLALRDLGSRSLSYKSQFSKQESSHSCPSWRSTLHCS